MRKLFLFATLVLSLSLCSVTAFADSLPPLIAFDTFVNSISLKPLPEALPPASSDTAIDETPPPASSDTAIDETPPPASSDTAIDETPPPASSDTPTDETLPPASSDTPTDETLPPASSDIAPDTSILSAEVAEIINELKTINNTLVILVYGLIPLTFAIVCIFFCIRWFCRTFIPIV